MEVALAVLETFAFDKTRPFWRFLHRSLCVRIYLSLAARIKGISGERTVCLIRRLCVVSEQQHSNQMVGVPATSASQICGWASRPIPQQGCGGALLT